MEVRKHNFTPVEKKILIDLVKKYSTIIESKEYDGPTLRLKNEAWQKITRFFNLHPKTDSNQTTAKQLRRLWMNLKQRRKEALIRQGLHRIAEGGPSLEVMEASLNAELSADMLQQTINNSTPIDPLLTTPTPTESHTSPAQLQTALILEKEYDDRKMRADEKHSVEMRILTEQLRESTAKADLAELILKQQVAKDD